MKKRIISLMLVVIMAFSLCVPAAAAYTERVEINYRAIKIVLNGETIVPCDAAGKTVEPFIMRSNGTTYLPLRAVAQALGLDVKWDGPSNTVTLTSGGEVKVGAGAPGTTTGKQNVDITYRDIKVFLNGEELNLVNANGDKVEPFILKSNSSVYLPLRVIGEALGLKVGWNGTTSTVTLEGHAEPEPAPDPEPAPEPEPEPDPVVSYTVTFKDHDGTVLKTETVEAGKAATAPTLPVHNGYSFDRWDKEFYNVSSDLVVTALCIELIMDYRVTFVDYDGTVLKDYSVKAGEAATAPAAPSREGYIFIGWDKSFDNVTSYLKVTALYEPVVALTFEKNAEGNGYLVAGCSDTAENVTIPAKYKNLPVTGIKGGAFADCKNLSSIFVDKDNQYLYSEGGVAFTDSPAKTLVCFPPAYDAANYYYVPADVKTIAPYAFAGMSSLVSLTIPEGVTTLGGYVFSKVKAYINVYVTESIINIGEHITQNVLGSVTFYGPNGTCKMANYCRANYIPYLIMQETTLKETTVKTSIPSHQTANLVPAGERVEVTDMLPVAGIFFEDGNITYRCNISQYEAAGREVYVPLGTVWSGAPDNFPAPTGLYGAGHTESDAVLRAYDKDGALIAMQNISGSFSFSFPKAESIGFEGGTNTAFTVMPLEPVFVSSTGSYAMATDTFYKLPNGNAFQLFVLQLPYTTVDIDGSNDLRSTYSFGDCADKDGDAYLSNFSSHYMIMRFSTSDVSRLHEYGAVAAMFDSMDNLMDTDEFSCLLSPQYDYAPNFAQRSYELFNTVKSAMRGTFYPSYAPIQKITILGNGESPNANIRTGIISINESVMKTFDAVTLAHEMIHAIDGSIAGNELVPAAWLEGRAEYISVKLFGSNGKDHSTFDWSYLSENDKADFFNYYYRNTNMLTHYAVGYHFLSYIIGKYGEDVCGRIMANIAEVTSAPDYNPNVSSYSYGPEFKKCVEDATEVGVFQNFVRDVIEG